jgi:outer membrane protein assembly factor BamB
MAQWNDCHRVIPSVSRLESSFPMQRFLLAFAPIWLILIPVSPMGADERRKESVTDPITLAPTDWPWWRGPNRNGVADAQQKPPLKWSASENVVWKTPVPGRGHGSPTVVGDRVFLATADHARESQFVLCYDRQTGKRLWQTEVHHGGFAKKGNGKSSLASSTVACDGQRLFINFLHAGAIYTTALSREGKRLWQTKITDYVLHQGFGSSPAVYRSLVIVSADNKGGGVLAGLDRVTGEIVWKQERPKLPNYASPIILKVADRERMLMTGCDVVASFDPLTGKKEWEVKGSTTECVTSTVTDGQLLFTSGGYPKNHVSAMRADGSGKIVWENKTRVYVPSMIVRDGYLYAVQDAGLAVCWKCSTGEEVWKGRLGGTFSSSLVLVGEHLFATNEAGRTFIFKATPEAFKLIAENQLGGDILATPTICGGRIYMRVATSGKGPRQEMLYCLGRNK